MKKQLVAAMAAVVLAALGVLSLVSYAQGANDRAFADAEMVEVLRVQTDVPSGTPAERVSGSVKLVKIPAVAKIDGALTSLDAVQGRTTNVALVAGEQVLASRFGNATKDKKADTAVPKGFHEVSIAVTAPRVAGGKVKVGDRVGVVASYDRKGGEPGYTKLALKDVLVTQVASASIADSDEGAKAAFLVTVALRTHDVEKLVNVSEYGHVWLTAQNDDTDTGGTKRTTGEDVLS
jgi:pilus assembly protein CpaB